MPFPLLFVLLLELELLLAIELPGTCKVLDEGGFAFLLVDDQVDELVLLGLTGTRVELLGRATPAKGGPLAGFCVVVVVVVVAVVIFPVAVSMTVPEVDVVKILILAPLACRGLEVTLKDDAGGLVLTTTGVIRFGDGGGS